MTSLLPDLHIRTYFRIETSVKLSSSIPGSTLIIMTVFFIYESTCEYSISIIHGLRFDVFHRKFYVKLLVFSNKFITRYTRRTYIKGVHTDMLHTVRDYVFNFINITR